MDFQIQRTIYHKTDPLKSTTQYNLQYIQLYFLDPEIASYIRFTINKSLNFSIISDLIKFLYEYNLFYIQYLTAKKQLKANPGQLQMVLNP